MPNKLFCLQTRSVEFQWILDPLYKLILNNGDPDYGPVSIAFAVACGVTFLSVIYTLWLGWRKINEVRDQTIHNENENSISSESSKKSAEL